MAGTTRRWLETAVCVVVCFLPGLVGSTFQPGEWYGALAKPALTPPNWLFPLAWSVLYATMGAALAIVWHRRSAPARGAALAVFALQLVLNAAWSWLFFGLHRPGWALIEISLLWFTILLSIALFRRVARLAAALLLPYLAWVTFAAWLNFELWRLNPGLSG